METEINKIVKELTQEGFIVEEKPKFKITHERDEDFEMWVDDLAQIFSFYERCKEEKQFGE
jgi:predicted transcriptional regulator